MADINIVLDVNLVEIFVLAVNGFLLMSFLPVTFVIASSHVLIGDFVMRVFTLSFIPLALALLFLAFTIRLSKRTFLAILIMFLLPLILIIYFSSLGPFVVIFFAVPIAPIYLVVLLLTFKAHIRFDKIKRANTQRIKLTLFSLGVIVSVFLLLYVHFSFGYTINGGIIN